MLKLYEQVLELAQQKVYITLEELDYDPERHPTHTDPETGKWEAPSSREWTSGFFAGILWQLYEWTADEQWKGHAVAYTRDLEREKYNAGDHDMGFRIFNSFGHAWRLTHDRYYRGVILQGVVTLSSRYDEDMQAIKSWDWMGTFPVIIDNIMNLELLFWAWEQTGNPKFRRIALEHAATTIEHHLREDGSHYHIVDLGEGGEVLWKGTTQGYDDNSTWSRGQAWGIHGFTTAWRYSKDPKHLEAARAMADYFLDHLPQDAIPYYDFLEPAIPNATRDVSAAAIAASGLVELYSVTKEPRYLYGAETLLLAMGAPPYLQEAGDPASTSSLLDKGTRWRGDPERGLIYADYYFLEALSRYVTLAGQAFPEIEPDFRFSLEQNFPNPFRGITRIHYSLDSDSRVQLSVYDTAGRKVRQLVNQAQPAGVYEIDFNGSGLASGLYYLRLETESGVLARPMVLIR